MTEQEIYEAVIKKFGEEKQLKKCIEELAELIQAICKVDLSDENSFWSCGVVEELVDVNIMLSQLDIIIKQKHFSYFEILEQKKEQKLKRLEKLINGTI